MPSRFSVRLAVMVRSPAGSSASGSSPRAMRTVPGFTVTRAWFRFTETATPAARALDFFSRLMAAAVPRVRKFPWLSAVIRSFPAESCPETSTWGLCLVMFSPTAAAI